MLELPRTRAPQRLGEESLDAWQPVEPLASTGSVALWRVSNGAGDTALLRLYPRFQREYTRRRFKSAAARRARLDHPGLLPLRRFDDQGRPRLLLADPVGESLATRIEREPLAPQTALRALADVATALDALADARLAPAGVSPADVFVLADGHGLLLADVGLLDEVLGGPIGTLRGRLERGGQGPAATSLGESFAAVAQAALTGPDVASDVADVLDERLSADPRQHPAEVVEALREAIATVEAGGSPPAARRRRPPTGGSAAPEPPSPPSRWRVAVPVVACVLAAAAGTLAGRATTAPDPPGPATLAAGGIAVEPPTTWALVRPADAPFDLGPGALFAQPASDAGVGLAVTRSAQPLRASLSRVEPEAVALRSGGAWRYENTRIGRQIADVYAIETAAGPLFAVCYAPPTTGRMSLATCGGVVGTLRADGTRVLPVGGGPRARAAVAGTLAALGRERASERGALERAGHRRAQAAAASGLAATYARTARTVATQASVGRPGWQAALTAALEATGRSYADLAAAASRADGGAYQLARTRIAERERAVDRALGGMIAVSKLP